ncbi:MAG: hypothetical protein JEY99_16945 [Spirochaetales bacterium]|nr:hypothetical protein [Spirochaetales bacterium]
MGNRYLIITLFSVIFFSTCNQFTPGLGERVDLDPPELTIDSHRNGDYVQASFTLSGTAQDDLAVSRITITHDETDFSAALSDEAWSLVIDSTEFKDGDHEFTIVVSDDDGKETSASIYLTVD